MPWSRAAEIERAETTRVSAILFIWMLLFVVVVDLLLSLHYLGQPRKGRQAETIRVSGELFIVDGY